MQKKTFNNLVFFVLLFLLFTCQNKKIRQYNKLPVNEREVCKSDTIEKIKIPTH
tara:strand:+ start:1278 stop:1439 length:162 start_codon:yes stop_codon:yes gene_type:complete